MGGPLSQIYFHGSKCFVRDKKKMPVVNKDHILSSYSIPPHAWVVVDPYSYAYFFIHSQHSHQSQTSTVEPSINLLSLLSITSHVASGNTWIIDSGATSHMTGNKNLFSTYIWSSSTCPRCCWLLDPYNLMILSPYLMFFIYYRFLSIYYLYMFLLKPQIVQ